MTRLSRRHTRIRLLATAVLLAGAATSILAQDGAYLVEPWGGEYVAVKIQPGDQKIVAAGSVRPTGGVAIARYSSGGNPDIGYGSGGLSTPAGIWGPLGGLALQSDGKAVVTARTTNTTFGAARFTTNGSLDGGFGSGGVSVTSLGPNIQAPYDVGLQSTGKIVVAGLTYGSPVGSRSAVLARFKAQGGLDYGKGGFGPISRGNQTTGYTRTNFGAQIAEFKGLAVRPDDKLVAVGIFSPTGSILGQLIVARYTAAGLLDATFNGGGYTVLNPPGISYTSQGYRRPGVALQADGKIVVASTAAGFDDFSDMLVARFHANGTLDTGFAGGAGFVRLDVDGMASTTSETGEAVVLQPDGRIVAVGSAYSSGTPSHVLVVRLNADGSPDPTFGTGGFKLGAPLAGTGYHSFSGKSVAPQSDGTIIVAGSDDQDATDVIAPHPLLMRFDP